MRSSALGSAVVIALVGIGARAQDLATYNKALAGYNAGTLDEAARSFYQVANSAGEGDLRLKAEYYLASTFQRLGLPFTAFIYFAPIVKAGPTHPFHGKAVEALITLQDTLNDDYLIPSLINNLYDQFGDSWATLPLEVLSRINYLIGRIGHRRAKLEEAKQFLEAVPPESGVYAASQYLLGITLADPRYPAANDEERRGRLEAAVEVFRGVLRHRAPNQKHLSETHQLAQLAVGRVFYNLGQYAESVAAYEQVPRFSKFWDQALFENGFARFQNDDPGGGLGSLQALHAPQFAGAFQPESWILKSTIYYFACLYDESKAALSEFEARYLAMAEKLRPLIEAPQKDNASYFKLVDAIESDEVPRPVLSWVRSNQRMLSVFEVLKQIDREKSAIAANPGLEANTLSAELVTYLDQNRATLEEVAGNFARSRLQEAYRTLRGFTDTAEVIRFEIAKAEKELAERGVDQGSLLKAQTLHRPAMPAENWNYWKFQGEFWRDEIGYYQYTLRRGCPAPPK